MRLGEINVLGTDLSRMRHFYCGLLGFEAGEQEGEQALHCSLGAARFLLLAVASTPAPRGTYGEAATISFDLITSELEADCQRLEAEGVSFAKRSDGRSAHVLDPDGNVIELIATRP